MTEEEFKFNWIIEPPARRALNEKLPESVAAACWEFITKTLVENPYRVTKQLNLPDDMYRVARREDYRIIVRIDGDMVYVEFIKHRRDAYHRR